MRSKLGVHVNHITGADAMRDFILNARPVVVKTVHHDAVFWAEIKAEYPELLLVGRKFCEHQRLSNPENEAEDLARWIFELAGIPSHLADLGVAGVSHRCFRYSCWYFLVDCICR